MYVILNQIKLFVFMKIQLDSPVNHPRIQATATVKAIESLDQTIMSIPTFPTVISFLKKQLLTPIGI